MTAAPILEIKSVTQRFGGLTANADISLSVGRGEILGLIGPNGAGKSTLFNVIAGTFPPTEGLVIFDGRDVTRLTGPQRCAAGIGRTYQVPKSFETMSVLENVTVGALLHEARASRARTNAYAILQELGLAGRAEAPAGELTPPERRRLEVARALATKPKLLLLDEVLTGLTPSEAQQGVALIRDIRQRGVTIIMVEHVMEIVMPLVDRAVVLDLGRVLAQGLPQDIVRNSAVIKAYLGGTADVA